MYFLDLLKHIFNNSYYYLKYLNLKYDYDSLLTQFNNLVDKVDTDFWEEVEKGENIRS